MHNASYNAVNYGLTYISCFSNVPVIRNAVKHYFRSVNRLKTANYYIIYLTSLLVLVAIIAQRVVPPTRLKR